MRNTTMDILDHIASVPLFQELPMKYHKDLATVVGDQVFRRRQLIFSEGDDAVGFYIIISGRVKIFKLSLEGKEQILHIFGPGEPIGEVAVFSGKRFPANAAAVENSRVLFFPRAAFMEIIQRNPSMALNMLAVLSQRLRKFTALIEDLSLKEVPGRLAAYLLYLGHKKDVMNDLTLDTSKGQLASLLGTIPETLSRILTRMASEGLIESVGTRRIRILDRNGLEELASGERRLHQAGA